MHGIIFIMENQDECILEHNRFFFCFFLAGLFKPKENEIAYTNK